MDPLCSGFSIWLNSSSTGVGADRKSSTGYAQALFVVDIFHRAVEVRVNGPSLTRTISNSHHELDLVARLVGTFLHLTDDLLHFVFRDGDRFVLGAPTKPVTLLVCLTKCQVSSSDHF